MSAVMSDIVGSGELEECEEVEEKVSGWSERALGVVERLTALAGRERGWWLGYAVGEPFIVARERR